MVRQDWRTGSVRFAIDSLIAQAGLPKKRRASLGKAMLLTFSYFGHNVVGMGDHAVNRGVVYQPLVSAVVTSDLYFETDVGDTGGVLFEALDLEKRWGRCRP
tara:strand:+ start:236 stop:541 length:306 start_codon:yes stop_codon:yes gene_type:complete